MNEIKSESKTEQPLPKHKRGRSRTIKIITSSSCKDSEENKKVKESVKNQK